MANHDAVTALDEFTLNTLSQQLHTAIYPRLFKDTVITGEEPVRAIQYDITSAPQFLLQPSQLALDYLHNQLMVIELTSADREAFRRAIAASIVTFDLRLPRVVVGIERRKGADVATHQGSIVAGCKADYGCNGALYITILTSRITIDGEPELTTLTNRILMPRIQMKLNDLLEKSLPIPALAIDGAELEAPGMRLLGRSLASAAALRGNGSTTMPEAPFWPARSLAFGFSAAATEAAAAAHLGTIERADSAAFSVQVWPFPPVDLKVEAAYSLALAAPRVDLAPEGPASIALEARGQGHLRVQLGDLPSIQVGIDIVATPSAALSFSVDERGVVGARLLQVDEVEPKLTIDGLPSVIASYLPKIAATLAPEIALRIGSMLAGVTIPIATLPAARLDLHDLRLDVELFNVEIATRAGDAERRHVAVTADLHVRSTSAAPAVVSMLRPA